MARRFPAFNKCYIAIIPRQLTIVTILLLAFALPFSPPLHTLAIQATPLAKVLPSSQPGTATSQQEIAAVLAQAHSLNQQAKKAITKQDLVNMTPEQRRAYFKSKKRALSPERKALRERAEKLGEYAKEQNWQEFLEIIKHFPFKNEMEIDHALFTAIIWKAPNSVFNALLNSGAHFTHIHTNSVTGKNDLNYLKRLVALGLDIHAQSHNGENAINALAELPYSTETLEYLLQQNVAIVMPQNSKSPVTVALTKAVKIDQAVLFAAKLLQYGAHPSAEDFALVEELKQQNPKAYQLVQAHIPELIKGE